MGSGEAWVHLKINRNTIDRLGTTFSDALNHPELKVISKQRVKNFLQSAYNAFAQTGLVQ
jgi:hypothetical protein